MGHHLKRGNKLTFARRILSLVPVDGGDRIQGNAGKERRAANVGAEGVRHDFVTPHASGLSVLNGNVGTPGESRVSIRMATLIQKSCPGREVQR